MKRWARIDPRTAAVIRAARPRWLIAIQLYNDPPQLEKQPPKTKESDARCPHPDQSTPSTQDTGSAPLSDDAQLRPDTKLADRRSGSKAKPYRLPFLPR